MLKREPKKNNEEIKCLNNEGRTVLMKDVKEEKKNYTINKSG